MTEWGSYRLSDFLLFSPRAYWRLFELQNEALWPLPLATLALGITVLALAILRPRHHSRLIALLLAILWAFVGWSFLWQRYVPINWVALYVVPLFALEALLFMVIGGFLNRLSFDRPGVRGIAGFLFIVLALAYPLLAPLFGRPWQAAEFFGIALDPTAIATLGCLLLAGHRSAIALWPIPLLWCLASGTTLWAMADPQAWIPFAAALLAVAAALRTATEHLAKTQRSAKQ